MGKSFVMLEILARLQIQKPIEDVFDAIVDNRRMSNYFISWASGPMEAGKEIQWRFPEFDEQFPVKVEAVKPPKYVSYSWEVDGKKLLVEMNLQSRDGGATLVSITEKGMENNEAGIKWLKGNTEGWANFLACLKAYLEHGINLRKGGFDFLKN